MAKVPLRVYNSDIEKLVEGGQIQEAIAHCRHILKIFPKHIDTYRLLGKAFLEGQRYTEAADILRRVLSVLPDDFISHLGMSIISEDEGNLDAAIYHMEKAYEIQPASPAIQGELRRLYGRRDGLEPPRIRLNRGALVRMYTRGELYPQAIAETRAALQEDPQRTDLQVILARLYYASGQKVQAVEIASDLVSKLPYCYEANRILSEVLPGSTRSDDAQVYQNRLVALDPYAGLVTPSMPGSADVPDIAVQIDRLEYIASTEEADTPEWAQNIGVTWEENDAAEAPQWMQPEQTSTSPARDVSEIEANETAPAAEAAIPDWMAAAGWAPADNAPDTGGDTAIDESDEDILAADGEIPEWLRSLAPVVSPTSGSDDDMGDEDEQWVALLSGDRPKEQTAARVESIAEDELSQDSDGLPEWLSDLAPSNNAENQPKTEDATTGGELDLPDWLSALETASQSPTVPQPPDPNARLTMDEADDATLPEWLSDLVPSQSNNNSLTELVASDEFADDVEPTGTPARLIDLATDNLDQISHAEPFEVSPPAMDTNEISPIEKMPLPAKGIEPHLTSDTGDLLHTSMQPTINESQPEDDMDAALAWLEALAAKQGADEATLLTPSEDRDETIPDWLQQQTESVAETPINDVISPDQPEFSTIESEGLLEPAENESLNAEAISEYLLEIDDLPVEIQPEETLPLPANDPGVEAENTDLEAGLAWLENLAQKQGVDESTLLLNPDERTETPPEWLLASTDIALEKPADDIEASRIAELETTIQVEQTDTVDTTSTAELEYESLLQPAGQTNGLEAQPSSQPIDATSLEIASTENTSEITQPVQVKDDSLPEQDLTEKSDDETVELEAALPVEDWTVDDKSTVEISDSSAVLPSWLSDLEPTQIGAVDGTENRETDLPDWLRELEVPSQTPADQPASVLTPPEWVREETLASIRQPVEIENIEPISEIKPILEQSTASLPESKPPAGPEAETPVGTDDRLGAAQQALLKGNVEQALDTYTDLIQSGELLEETIHDLRDATYRFPTDIGIWQALGDAYLRGNRLQDALDAYTKAEELLR